MGRALVILRTDADRQRAAHYVAKAPWETRIEFKASKRSLPQNDRFWAMLTDVAAHMKAKGRDYSTEEWKLLFMHAWGREVRFLPGLDQKSVVPIGQSSSDLSKDEMTDLIEFIFAWGAENGVKFNESSDGPSSTADVGASGKICSVDGCENVVDCQGFCRAHYKRLKVHGDPTGGRPTMAGEPRKFFDEVVVQYTGDDCLIWPYTKNSNGRAGMRVGDKQVSVHRLACIAVHGEPPTPDHEAAHNCGKGHEGCVNPRHLRWATKEENEADKAIHGTVWRGGNPRKTGGQESLSPESGTEAGDIEAGHGAAASPASGSVSSVQRMLMEECIDNMLRDAMSKPAEEASGKIDKVRAAFMEPQNLGDFPDFVNRCAETAKRIIGKTAERDKAKEYLTGRMPA